MGKLQHSQPLGMLAACLLYWIHKRPTYAIAAVQVAQRKLCMMASMRQLTEAMWGMPPMLGEVYLASNKPASTTL